MIQPHLPIRLPCYDFTPVINPAFGSSFLSENSNTTRHAAEFWMIEPEMAFADLDDNMALAEGMLKYVIQYVLDLSLIHI